MGFLGKKRRVDAEIRQIIQNFHPYWSQLKAWRYYVWSWSKALSHAFRREEEGTVLSDIEARLTRNLCECILYLYGEINGIPENVPRFLKNAFHIPEECHFGLAFLYLSAMHTLSTGCLMNYTLAKKMNTFDLH